MPGQGRRDDPGHKARGYGLGHYQMINSPVRSGSSVAGCQRGAGTSNPGGSCHRSRFRTLRAGTRGSPGSHGGSLCPDQAANDPLIRNLAIWAA